MSDKQHNPSAKSNQSEQVITGFNRQILEASPVSMILVDAQAHDMPIVYVNAAFQQLTGYSRDEIIGRNCRFLQGDDRNQPDLDILRNAIKNKEACTATLRNYRKDNTLFWNELRVSPIFGTEDQVTYFVGIQTDVTRREEALDQLKTTSANLRAMLDSTNQSFTLIDRNARVVDFDRQGAQIAEDIFGKLLRAGEDIYDYVLERDIESFTTSYNRALAGETVTVEKEFNGQDATYYFEVTYYPVIDAQGDILGVCMNTENITERKQMEEELASNMTDLKLAQRIASVGNWTFDPEVGVPVWSAEVYKIYERDPQLGPPSLEDYQKIYTEQDFDRFWTAIQTAISEGKPYDIKLGLSLPGGKQKWIHAICEPEPEKGPAGHLLRGTIQDVSEIYYAQEALRESEERFRQLAEHIEAVFWLIDLESSSYLYISPAYDTIWQRSRLELMDKGLEAFVSTLHPEDRDWAMKSVRDWLMRSLRESPSNPTEAAHKIEHRIVRPSGEIRSVETAYFPIRNKSGDVYRIAIITQDITERKQIEEALHASEAYLQSVINTQSTFVLRTDMEGRYTYVNDAMYDHFKWMYPGGKADMLGTDSMLTIIPEDHQKTEEAVIACIMQPGQPVQVELCKPGANGSVFWVLWNFVALTNSEGDVTEMQCAGIDVTERKQAQQREFELKLERERRRLLTSFIQDAAHEFRTPLTIINTSAYLMSRSEDAEHRLGKFTRIESQTQLITKLVDMLLLMSNLESYELPTKTTVDLQALIHEVRQEMQEKFSTRYHMEWDVASELPQIIGNAQLLTEAFRQIIENACRFTPEGGKITFAAQTDDQQVAITVQDTGRGIQQEDLPRIFDTFWRQDTAHSISGLGLGLPIVQKIIERHGGEITIESEEEQGTTVRISLPVA